MRLDDEPTSRRSALEPPPATPRRAPREQTDAIEDRGRRVQPETPAPLADHVSATTEHAPGELTVPPGYSVLEGEPAGERRAVGVVVARFNGDVTTRLLESALAELEACGVARDAVTVMPVPGAFELPLAAMALAKTRRFACIVALGCVIRGDTPHFDYVSSEAASGLQLAAIETGVPGRLRRAHARPRRPGREPHRQGGGGGAHRPRDGRPVRQPARSGRALGARRARRGSRLLASSVFRRTTSATIAACPRSAHSAGRSPASGTTGATRWSPPSAASTRTCSASG